MHKLPFKTRFTKTHPAINRIYNMMSYVQVQMCAALWATGVKCFFHKLDAITGSTAAPVEALVVSAEMGDRTLHSEQADYVKTLCSAIKEATRNASEG